MNSDYIDKEVKILDLNSKKVLTALDKLGEKNSFSLRRIAVEKLKDFLEERMFG